MSAATVSGRSRLGGHSGFCGSSPNCRSNIFPAVGRGPIIVTARPFAVAAVVATRSFGASRKASGHAHFGSSAVIGRGRASGSRLPSHGATDPGISFIDYYRLLDVAPDATREDIKRAYRFLQKRCHPDISGHDLGHGMAVILNEAYATLTDPRRRRSFDADLRSRKALASGYTGKALSAWAGAPEESRALFVDEATCVGCHRCAFEAGNTFAIEMKFGRARALRQWGDSEEALDAAVGVCPVNCIHWVQREQLPALEHVMRREMVASQGTTDADPFYAADRFLQGLQDDPVAPDGEPLDRYAAEASIRMRAVGSSSWWHYARGGWRGAKGASGQRTGAIVLARDHNVHLPPYGRPGGLSAAVLEYLMAAAGGTLHSLGSEHHHDQDEYWERLESAEGEGRGSSSREGSPREDPVTSYAHQELVPRRVVQQQPRRAGSGIPLGVLVGFAAAMILANTSPTQPVSAEECYHRGGGMCRLFIKQ